MDAAVERRAFDLYEDLLYLSPGDRDSRLDETCAGEPALAAAVKAMFAADSRGHLLLPTIPPDPRPASDGDDLSMPERIGPFRIVSEIGRGGMGVVYRAERDDGLYEQSVAIKLIRSTVFSQRALAQFAIERRILAKLHHPHIAQMLEGGVTADGASYIVMELVEGASVTDYAEAGRLRLHDRLDLFEEVAEAIEHAHRNLVVHADIKPSNVLVCEGFGVKLLDFGISRLLNAEEAGNAAYTPGFGSPARQAGLPSTPADDIYALGVLLRALIDGVAGVDGDLRAIADHACHADHRQRYGTVGALVDDIARWRRRKPVSARPANKARLARLFWHRHRLAVSAAAAALVLVLATAVTTTILWRRAETARAAAEQRFEETRALSRYLVNDVTAAIAPLPGSSPVQEQIARHAERALEKLSRVPGASPEVQADSAAASARIGTILAGLDQRTAKDPLAAQRALTRAEQALRPLIAAHPDRADLRLTLASTLVSKATFLAITRNDNAAAFRALGEVARLTDALLARDPRLQAARDARWDADLLRAEAYDRDDRYGLIPALLTPYLHGPEATRPPQGAQAAMRLSQTWVALGNAQYYLGDKPAGLASYRRGLAVLSAPALATDMRVTLRIIFDEFNISSTLADLGRKPEALAEAERGVMQARRLRSFDDTPKARHMSNIAELQYAVELADNRRFDEAIATARAGIAGREALARLEPGSYDAQRAVPVGMRPLAEMLRAAGHRDEACAVARDTAARWAALARRWSLAGFDDGPERGEVAKLTTTCHAKA